ncbi:hypothetical protein ISS39_10425 [Candidatus Bathyarchaeota archaeon]|nr:hypothetical protein [Candidatus Bathyarchaeota archaeon]
MEAWMIRCIPVNIFEIADFADFTGRLIVPWHAELRPEIMVIPDFASVTVKRK